MLALGIKDFEKNLRNNDCMIIDTRLPDFFENGFIKGSINIPLNKHFQQYLQWLNPQSPLLFVFKQGTEDAAIENIKNYNKLNVIGYLKGGFDTWINHFEEYDMIISISSEEFVLDALHNPKAVIVDVREHDAFKNSHVKDAINLPLIDLFNQYEKLKPESETLIYGNDGSDSMVAASFLKKMGFRNIKNVWGGFSHIASEPKFQQIKG